MVAGFGRRRRVACESTAPRTQGEDQESIGSRALEVSVGPELGGVRRWEGWAGRLRIGHG